MRALLAYHFARSILERAGYQLILSCVVVRRVDHVVQMAAERRIRIHIMSAFALSSSLSYIHNRGLGCIHT